VSHCGSGGRYEGVNVTCGCVDRPPGGAKPEEHCRVSELFVRAIRLDLDPLIPVAGELDLHSVEPLREELERAIDGAAGGVVVNLEDVRFFDSIALGMLANAATRLRGQGRRLAVVSVEEGALSPFARAGLDRLITLRRTLTPD
jgi:anti-anti-sigma factor